MPNPLISRQSLVRASAPLTSFDDIVVYAYETRTGRVAQTVPYIGQPTWASGINYAGAWRVQVPIGNKLVDAATLDAICDPWVYSWAVAQGDHIWQAGPMVTESCPAGSISTTVSGVGLWGLLTSKRILANWPRAALWNVTSLDSAVAFGPTGTSDIGSTIPAANQNLSLGTIAKRICQTIELAPGGDLPILYPPDVPGTSQRTYPAYDLVSPGQRVMELTQVIGGPEIEFVPSFTDSTRQFIQHTMRIGDDVNAGGRLGNLAFNAAWDYQKACVDIGRDVDGSGRLTRDWERGNGMQADLVTGFYDQPIDSRLASALLLEGIGGNHTSSSNVTELNGYAQAAVQSNLQGVPTYTALVRVPGDDGFGRRTRSPMVTNLANGDNGLFAVENHRRLVDGVYGLRIIGMSNATDPQVATLQTHFLGRTNL